MDVLALALKRLFPTKTNDCFCEIFKTRPVLIFSNATKILLDTWIEIFAKKKFVL